MMNNLFPNQFSPFNKRAGLARTCIEDRAPLLNDADPNGVRLRQQ